MTSLAVLGGGAWGTALANVLARQPVILWARDRDHVARMQAERENTRNQPGVPLAGGVAVTADMAACAQADIVLAVIPTQALRSVLREARAVLKPDVTLILCAKGIERGTSAFPSEIAANECPAAQVAALSGPSFADDVARGLPTAVTLACADGAKAEALCEIVGSRTFRPYASADVRGVEIGGAAKNVLAVACGIAEGRGLGASARAALTTRGFAELSRFGAALGARPETLTGLSGLGDLLLTCGSAQSRNFSLGLAIGRDVAPAQAVAERLAEGAWTAPVLVKMARDKGVAMPIAEAVDAILAGRTDVAGAVESLLARPYRRE